MFNVKTTFKTSDFASVRAADNLSLNEARYLVRIADALGLGPREIFIGWDHGANGPRISVEDFEAQGGNPNEPIEIFIRHQKEISTGNNPGAQSVIGSGMLAAQIALAFNNSMWRGFEALAAPLIGNPSPAAVLQLAVDKVPGMGAAIAARVQEVVASVRRI